MKYREMHNLPCVTFTFIYTLDNNCDNSMTNTMVDVKNVRKQLELTSKGQLNYSSGSWNPVEWRESRPQPSIKIRPFTIQRRSKVSHESNERKSLKHQNYQVC